MTRDGAPAPVGELSPTEAWEVLGADPDAVLVDVRTQAEWKFVGVPDLGGLNRSTIFVEWQSYPDMSVNPRFVAELMEKLGGAAPSRFLFICRSGARSLRAAEAVRTHLASAGDGPLCINVAEGFEGDLDAAGHRGRLNGWKSRGLAWRQS